MEGRPDSPSGCEEDLPSSRTCLAAWYVDDEVQLESSEAEAPPGPSSSRMGKRGHGKRTLVLASKASKGKGKLKSEDLVEKLQSIRVAGRPTT